MLLCIYEKIANSPNPLSPERADTARGGVSSAEPRRPPPLRQFLDYQLSFIHVYNYIYLNPGDCRCFGVLNSH